MELFRTTTFKIFQTSSSSTCMFIERLKKSTLQELPHKISFQGRSSRILNANMISMISPYWNKEFDMIITDNKDVM